MPRKTKEQLRREDLSTLDEFLTSPTSPGDAIDVVDASVREEFLGGNPLAMDQEIVPEWSESAAHGFLLLVNQNYYDLLDSMVRKDPSVNTALKTATALVTRLPWEVREPEGLEDGPELDLAGEIRDALRADLQRSNFGELISSLVRYSLQHGVSINEVIWRVEEDRFAPGFFIHRHPGQFAFDIFRNLYIRRSQEQGYLKPSIAKFIVTRTPAPYGNPYGEPILDCIRVLWWFKKQLIKSWLETCEVFGTPLTVGKFAYVQGEAQSERIKQHLETVLRNLRRKTGIVIPEQVTLEFKDRMSGRGALPHEAAIRYLDVELTRSILGSMLAVMDSKHESRAASETHFEVMDVHARPGARRIETAFSESLAVPYAELNYGRPDLAPVLQIETETEIETQLAIEVLRAAKELQLPVTAEQAREWLNLRAPEEGDEVLEVAPPEPEEDEEDLDLELPFREPRRRIRVFAEGDREEAQARKELDAIAEEGAKDARAHLLPVFREYLDRLPSGADGERVLNQEALEIWRKMADNLLELPEEETMLPLMAARLVEDLSTIEHVSRVEELPETQVFADPTDNLPEGSIARAAARWMLARNVMSVARVNRLARGWATLHGGLDEEGMRRALRRHVMALSRSASEKVTKQVAETLSSSIARGETFTDWRSRLESSVREGELPLRSDAYLENVYRTETSNAYAVQRVENEAHPVVDSHLWGWQWGNPDDERSRPSHAEMNGLLIKKGSPAANALGSAPPLSYQCRCWKTPIMMDDPDAATFEEDDDAYELISQAERF